jgi:tRNA (guanine37-N1)-methyltransferase
MTNPWEACVITLMPDMYPGPLAHSLIGDALENGTWKLHVVNLREYGIGKHQVVDDSPYGGGAGMVIKPDVMDAAIEAAKKRVPNAQLVHLTPRGERLTQPMLSAFTKQPLILMCGRYEAIDERVIEKHQPREVSLGDFVLTGGDIPAMAIIEGTVRLLPNVVGDTASLAEESFGIHDEYQHLLEYPHYTKPAEWDGRTVPEVLTSGHHKNIDSWRKAQAEEMTKAKRPDLWEKYKKTRSA